MTRHVVAPASAVPVGGRLLVEAGGKRIVIFHLRDGFFGLLDRWPHQGGPLSEGVTTGLVEADPTSPGQVRYSRPGEILRCPWHGWEFDIRTGLSQCEPGRIRTRCYPAEVLTGDRLDPAELAAVSVPVAVEEAYLVVHV